MAPEDRPKVGQWVNEARGKIEALLEETKKKLEAEALEQKLKEEVIDVTLPAKRWRQDTDIPTPSLLRK